MVSYEGLHYRDECKRIEIEKNSHEDKILFNIENKIFPVAMRLRVTPVPISNTMVKP